MDNKKLERWAQLLLDTGKRNNLINFKDSKASTAEVVYPDPEVFFEKCLNSSSFEIYDPKIEEEDESDVPIAESDALRQEVEQADKLKRSDYISVYAHRIRKNNQVLAYAQTPNPITAIRNIDKRARDFLEETGVNVSYLAFGFVHWRESENSDSENRAPLLLVPITLKNESLIKPYNIELTGDDVVTNPTFKYLLEAQYGIKLPEYEQDESLLAYIESVQSIVSKLHWLVTTECKIGIFSFLKINMYHDLMNNSEEILKSDNVRLLMGEAVDEEDDTWVLDERKLKDDIIDLHTVVDADSSQMEAIEMVKSGRSFVLQGPPGTGKSQTITNIIAECLHDGKKVLFVSEKQAALNVVYDKLKKAGLEEFCLELHSHKANKKEVIAELCRTMRADRSAVSSKADVEVREKAKLQEQLDSYAEALHKNVSVINRSLYQLYEAYSAYRKAPQIDIILNEIETKGEAYLNEAVSLLSQYEEYIPTIGENYKNNEWYGFYDLKITYEEKSKLKHNLQMLVEGLEDFIPKAEACKDEYSIDLDTLIAARKYIALFDTLSKSDYIKPQLLNADNSKRALNVINNLNELSDRIIPIRTELNECFEESVYRIDGQDIYNKLAKLYSGCFSRLFNSEYKNIINEIRLATKLGKKPSYKQALDQMKSLADYQSLGKQFDEENAAADAWLYSTRINVDTDWPKLRDELMSATECVNDDLSGGTICGMTLEVYETEKPRFGSTGEVLTESLEQFASAWLNVQDEFDIEQVSLGALSLEDLQDKLQQCLDSMDGLDHWMSFYILLKQLEKKELNTFVDEAIKNSIANDQYARAYQRLFYDQWINHVIYSDAVLSKFSRISQDKAVIRFAEKDKLQFDISKAQIKAELSAKRPSLDMVAGGSAVSILLREGEKKRKQKSIRVLLEEAGGLIQVIKPCFLMSPLSVSTFLSNNGVTFDTVVFDEASQIFPQDAIGAIYRGKQLIVVGDSRQMPPSNFFNSSVEMDDDDEETGDVTDFESILDLCSTSLPQLRLKWHYRSRYEQLITFSNKNFYDNALISFPSSTLDHKGVGVDYYHVDGLFDRKSHTNRREAEFIVDLIWENIDQYPNRSLGVVAFSVAQQDLIERLLSKRRQEDTSKEWFFKYDETVKEPFFVKNLETVQGDERDTIIFSVAYGMDAQGRLLHNFGPLNRAGGERRLNVAVTRAKDNVQLVSSMHGTDIDLSRTSAEGARLLKEYLDYAENGEIALERSITLNPFEQYDSEFEMDVCEFLREKGFTVDTQIGCSGFRIDMGIRKPDSSDYVLAVECDGATYHSSKNARDRDRLRQEILERMGWRFYRIWSTDWFRNNTVEKKKLLKAATEAIDLGPYTQEHKNTESVTEAPLFEKSLEPEHLTFPEYREADVFALHKRYGYSFQDFVRSIMDIEAPISEEYLLKRICCFFARDKVTSVVRNEYLNRMRGCHVRGIIRRNGWLYLEGQNGFELRVPGVKRDIKYIAIEELTAGLQVLLQQNVTADKEGLYRTLGNHLGFSRLGDAMYARFDEALAKVKGITISGNTITWNG